MSITIFARLALQEWAQNRSIGEGQTTIVPRGGIPINPATFNASTVDQWWNVVPEFPTFLIPPILMMATLLAFIVYRRRKPRPVTECEKLRFLD